MSGVYCSVLNCTSSTNRNRNLRFFSFPKDGERCRLWIVASGRKDLMHLAPRSIQRGYIICELHFKPSDFYDGKLKMMAVPSLNLDKDRPRSREARRESVIQYPTPPIRARANGNKSMPKDEFAAGTSQTTRHSSPKLQEKKGKKDANKEKDSKKQK